MRSSAFRVCSAFMVWAWVRSPRQRRKMPPAHCVPFFICFGFFPSALGTSSKICSCATSDSWTTPLATDLFFCRCPLRGSPHCTCFMLCHRWLCNPAAALFLLSRARGVVYSRGCTTSRTVEVHLAVVLLCLCFLQQAATHFFEQLVPSKVYMFGANLTSGLFVDCVCRSCGYYSILECLLPQYQPRFAFLSVMVLLFVPRDVEFELGLKQLTVSLVLKSRGVFGLPLRISCAT